MSGIYIPGMEMPKGELGSVPVVIFADGAVCHFFTHEKLGNAIPVPDHGGLIDRIALLNALPDDYRIPSKAAKVLENAIIPADKE